MKDTQFIPYTIGIVLFILLILKVNEMGLFDFIRNGKKSASSEIDQRQFDNAEIQLIELIFLVESENKEVFAELTAYSGSDKNRHLKNHLNLADETESGKNDLYFNSLKKIIQECREAEPSSGDIETDFTFIIDGSEKVLIGEEEVIRVHLKYCTPDEEACLNKAWMFDFVMGEKAYLLMDIDEAALYK